jgi:hypothetical protein
MPKSIIHHGLNTQIPSIYAYGKNTPPICGSFAILVMLWDGEQENRHKIAKNAQVAKIFEMLQSPYQVC